MAIVQKNALKNGILAIMFSFSMVFTAFANDEAHQANEHSGKFNAGETILHHIADSHEWHFFSITNTDGTEKHISLQLPVILYVKGEGLKFYNSAQFAHGHEVDGFTLHHDKFESKEGKSFYDFSITKNVASMLISMVILLSVFLSVAGAYKKRAGMAPKGFQGVIEPIIMFVRDEVVYPNLGNKTDKFLPYLLTVFFYIWVNNLLGLLPGGANVTGNIAVTLTLAVFTFIITNVNGNKDYWGHIFNTPGAPWWIKFLIPLMPIIEIIGAITKPFALMVRLFANISAGHIIILSLLSLGFIFRSLAVGIGGALFATAMNVLELLVAVLQAYVFTLLSSVFIGAAVAEHHHDEHHEHEHGHEKAHAHAH